MKIYYFLKMDHISHSGQEVCRGFACPSEERSWQGRSQQAQGRARGHRCWGRCRVITRMGNVARRTFRFREDNTSPDTGFADLLCYRKSGMRKNLLFMYFFIILNEYKWVIFWIFCIHLIFIYWTLRHAGAVNDCNISINDSFCKY